MAGGFHVVIGNPPYGAHFSGEEASYLRKRYGTFRAVPDVYVSFIERSLARLADGGMLAFIVPSAWLGGPAYAPLRLLLLTHTIEAVVLLPFDVFAAAYIDTAIFALSKRKPPTDHRVRTHVYGKRERLGAVALTEQDYSLVNQQEWAEADGGKFVLDPGALRLLAGIQARTSVTLGQSVDMKRGVLFDRKLLTTTRTTPLSFPYFEGDVYRYRLNLVADRWVEFGDQMRERPKELIWFQGTRLLLRRLVNRRQRLMAVLASETFITNKNLYSLLVKEPGCSIAAVLGVLNSRLISFVYMRRVTQATKDDFPQVTVKDVLALPFPSPIEAARHDRMVALVEQMLDLHKKLAAAAIPEDRALYERQIESTDRQIDALVYELYGLTDEEIALVEGVAIS